MITKSQLRHDLRQIRTQLDPDFRIEAARHVCQQVCALPEFLSAKTIAAYSAFDNELSPHFIVEQAWQLGKTVTLPKVLPNTVLQFNLYQPQTTLLPSRFGILEVDSAEEKAIAIDQHDLILLPMLAFDANCNRIGMGKGYYDRNLNQIGKNKPVLIGIAYEFQCVKSILIDSWDIKMDKIVTEKRVYAAK